MLNDVSLVASWLSIRTFEAQISCDFEPQLKKDTQKGRPRHFELNHEFQQPSAPRTAQESSKKSCCVRVRWPQSPHLRLDQLKQEKAAHQGGSREPESPQAGLAPRGSSLAPPSLSVGAGGTGQRRRLRLLPTQADLVESHVASLGGQNLATNHNQY